MDGSSTEPALRSPTSPRLRPIGPRHLNRRVVKATLPLPLNLAFNNEAAPAYPGRSDSPSTIASNAGSTHSPAAASLASLTDLPPLDLTNERPEPDKSFSEQGVQVTPPTTLSTPSVTRSSTPAIKVVAKPPTLTPPPALNFEPTPVAWKGMTLETAQWSLSSEQLQEVVSKAIRKTAQESFIRLLSSKTHDEELVEEMSRLETLQATTQSQYRFNMHRRTNLLQSLLALSGSDTDGAVLAGLTTQLADVTATCDKLMQELLQISDQRAQIQNLQDVHLTSALAMALRKLNSSYARRISELRDSRNQIEQLKSELEEAWKVAEEMAQEMDDLDNFHSGFSSGSDGEYNDESVRLAEVIGITGTAVAMKATLTQIHEGRIKEREEVKSERSKIVSAAKKRSSQMSKASLRIPGSQKSSTNGDAASISSRRKSIRQRAAAAAAARGDRSVPPLPSLQADGASTSTKREADPKSDSFLDLVETRPVSPASPVNTSSLPPPPIPTTDIQIANPANPSDAVEHSKRGTLNFDIPPINVYPAEGHAHASSHPNGRRVQSMQPASRPSFGENDIHSQNPPEYKRFEDWLSGGVPVNVNHNRRSSMPMGTPLGVDGHLGPESKPSSRALTPPPQLSGSTP